MGRLRVRWRRWSGQTDDWLEYHNWPRLYIREPVLFGLAVAVTAAITLAVCFALGKSDLTAYIAAAATGGAAGIATFFWQTRA